MHTSYIYKIKEENLPKLSVYRIWRKCLRTQERVRLIHGKRAIGVRAIEVLLYSDTSTLCNIHYLFQHLNIHGGALNQFYAWSFTLYSGAAPNYKHMFGVLYLISWTSQWNITVDYRCLQIQEILRDIRISTYQICRIEEKINRKITFHKLICNFTPEIRDTLVYWKYCGKEETLLLRSNFSF